MTVIILAGGKASRMKGLDKAFLKIGSEPMIILQMRVLKKNFKKIIIVTNLLEKYGVIKGVKVISDIIPHQGPLGGIYSGLMASNSFYNFVVACDMPFLHQYVIEYMLEQSKGYDVVVPEHKGRLEPLCAVYSKNCIRPIENQLCQNNLKITDSFQYVKTRVITEQEITNFDPQGMCFININTAEDYERFKYNQPGSSNNCQV